MPNVGYAALQVIPTMKGAESALAAQIIPAAGAAGGAAGAAAGSKMKKRLLKASAITGAAGKSLTKAFTLPLVGLGVAAFKAADDVGDAHDSIKVSTGKTGKALKSLQDSFDAIAKKTPADFDTISGAVSTLAKTTGMSGRNLNKLTTDILEGSRMLGEDGAKNAQLFGKAMVQWHVPAKNADKQFTRLYTASQKYDVSLGDLTNQLNQYGPIMQNAGFSMTETADLFGQMNTAGLKVSRLMPGLNAAFRNWAKDGKDPQKMLSKTIDKMADAKTSTKALAIATDAFGAEGAQRLTTAVRSGAVSFDKLGKAISKGGKDITEQGKKTRTFGENMKQLKNTAEISLAPLGNVLFPLVTDAIKAVIPKITKVAEWFDNLSARGKKVVLITAGILAGIGPLLTIFSKMIGVVMKIGKAIKAVTTVMRALNLAMLTSPVGILVISLVALGALFVVLWKKSDKFREIVTKAWEKIKAAAQVVTDWFMNTAWPWMKQAMQWIGDKASWLWKNALKPAFDKIWSITRKVLAWIKDTGWPWFRKAMQFIGDKASWLWKTILHPTFNLILSIVRKVFGWIKNTGWPWAKKAFDGIGKAASWLWKHFLKPNFNTIKAAVKLVISGFKAAKRGIKSALDGIGTAARWLWKHFLKPNFNTIKSAVGKVKTGFVKAKDGIVSAWDKIRAAARKPVAFVINRVVRPFLGGINKVLGFVHLPKIPRPKKMHTGGIMPGYTPGRDVHQFYSPTGGRLDLSGGEAVMRPEFTRAFGESGVNALNRAAAHGGPSAVRKTLGFKDGGVLPHRKFGWGGIWDKVKGAGSWLKDHTIGAAKMIWDFIRHPKDALKSLLPDVGNSWAGKLAASLPGKLAGGLKSMISKAFGGGGGGGSPVNMKPVKGGGGLAWSGIESYRPWLRGALVNVLRKAQRQGWSILEFPPFGPVHRVHSAHSLHYLGQAADISTPGMRGGDAMARALASAGFGVKWKVPGHYNHIHVDTSILDHMYGAWRHVPGYANGGRPRVGAPAIVGENGPEMFVPDRSGTILSNSDSRAFARGPVELSGRSVRALADAVAHQVIEVDGHALSRVVAGYLSMDRASQRIQSAGMVSA